MIPRPGKPQLLLQHSAEGWLLPSFEPEVKHVAMVGQNNGWVRDHMGLECITLYLAHVEDRRTDAGRIDATYILENRDADWSPPDGAHWIDREELAGIEVTVPGQKAIMKAWLDELEGHIEPPRRGAWNLPGWYDEASSWIREQLASHGIEMTAPPQQFKHWNITSALRVPTTNGDYYFKAVPRLFAQEPRITATLAARYPEYVPAPLSARVRPEEGWMLMPDFKGEVLERINVEQVSEALRNLARMQLDSVSQVDELLTAGFPDRRLERLAEELNTLLHDPVALDGLLPEEIKRLQRLESRFEEMCLQLSAYGVPQTLLHGDFHGGNLLIRDGKLLIFDWTDGCIGHPFLDLITALDNRYPRFEEHEQTAIREAYIAAWTEYETPERLLEAAQLAWPLGALHQAVSYRGIMSTPSDETRRELVGAAGYFLKHALTAVEQHPDLLH